MGRPAKGGGGNGKKKGGPTREVTEKCRKWLAGERASLWLPAPRRGKPREPTQSSREELEARAVELAGEGMLGKAAGVFKGELPAMVSDESTADMRAKHPEARVSEPGRCAGLRAVAGAAAPLMTVEEVTKGIKGFPQGSAGGKSGLKPPHLKDALVPGYGDELVRTLTEVTNLLASGKAHPSAREWICCASLTALSKPDGSLRPIAIGETLRRLVGKVLAKDASEDFQSFFEPSQVGVGSKGGAEAVVHTVRQYMARNSHKPGVVIATLDLKNAFNCVDRSAFRAEIRRVAPRLAPWVDFQYGAPTPLYFGATRLSSERGVQQGDPLGPALFAAALHPHIQDLQSHLDGLGVSRLDLNVFLSG